MKMKDFVSWCACLLVVLFMASSCATSMTTKVTSPDGTTTETSQPGSMFGPSSYDVGYAGMYQSWRGSQASRSATMASLPCPDDSVAAAYCNSSKMMGMAMMSMERFDVKAPTTGFDVIYKGLDSIVPVAGFVSLYKLGVSGITNAGSSFGNGATVSDSLNHTTQTSTAAGYGASSTGTATGTIPQQVVSPEIVTPEVITLPATTP